MVKAHILYVEDDETLSMLTQEHLEQQGYLVTHKIDGKSALETIRNGAAYDLYILDVMLPEIDGFDLATTIRRKDIETPILFLSAKSMKEDRIQGLRIGADDYITKPYSMEELLLKIEVFLRRSKVRQSTAAEVVSIGDIEFEYQNLILHQGGEEVTLTQREADLLMFLWKNRNQVVRRSDILEALWGEDDYFLGRSLDVFISRLRKYCKFDDRLKIENIHGVGFKLKCPE
ncbi:MAG: response regulator transcription factor [Saprospiraceae bacterium]|nr:response regulator transcription factor [Saprospiraceae bacterium]